MRPSIGKPLALIPACSAVNDCAGMPYCFIASESSATLCCSPVASSWSISRPSFSVATSLASASSSSVMFPIAETTTATRKPLSLVFFTICATCLILSESATDEPPNFSTVSGIFSHSICQHPRSSCAVSRSPTRTSAACAEDGPAAAAAARRASESSMLTSTRAP